MRACSEERHSCQRQPYANAGYRYDRSDYGNEGEHDRYDPENHSGYCHVLYLSFVLGPLVYSLRMMVKHTRILFGAGDILKVRIVCVHCEGETDLPLRAKLKKLPTFCSYCKHEWYDPDVADREVAETLNLLRAAHYLAATHGDLPFKARFEIDGDEAKG